MRTRLLSALSLTLACAALSAREGTEVPLHKAAQAAIVALSQNLDAPDVSARAAAIVKEHDSCDISSIFKLGPRGLGIGALGKAGHRDSIERLIQDYARKAPPAGELVQFQDDLMRTAKALQAMAELAPHRGPGLTTPQKLPEFNKVAAEFKETTRGFREAVEARDPARVNKAAKALNNTCCHCHEFVN